MNISLERYGKKPNNCAVLVVGPLNVFWGNAVNPAWQWGKGRIHFLPRPAQRIRAILERVRLAFPTAWAIGLRCCDHGGRVMSWCYDIDWGFWDHKRFKRRWNGAGDGEIYQRISFWQFFLAWRNDWYREKE